MNDFDRRTWQVAKSFLQSVVILDDRAWLGPEKQPVGDLRPPEYSQPDTASSGDETGQESIGASLNAKTVIDGFASHGLVCAVLTDELQNKVVTAARRADIVVLDWNMGGNGENTTLGVIKEILSDDQLGNRLRLIAVYTGEPQLDRISQQVKQTVNDYFNVEVPDNEEVPLCMSWGPVRVVVLAKNPTISRFRDHAVCEDRLADKLICEFANMAGGLIGNAALAGMATLRNEVHYLLTMFHARLDPAYLGHRARLHHPPDAETHVTEALGAELLNLLEQNRAETQEVETSISEWLQAKIEGGLDIKNPIEFGSSNLSDGIHDGMAVLVQGIEKADLNFPNRKKPGRKALAKKATEIFASNEGLALQSDRHFSTLLHLKNGLPKSKSPRLTLGTILRKGCNGLYQYYLCVQPKCDSVRLKKMTAFPLLRLSEQPCISKRFRLVVATDTNDWVHLDYEPKPENLTSVYFKPGPNPPGSIEGCSYEDQYYFEDSGQEKGKYWWMAEMRDEHALRVSGDLAAALARPGPNEAEWLRGTSKR